MPRAKQKAVGAGRRQKTAPVATPQPADMEAEVVIASMDEAALAMPHQEEMSATEAQGLPALMLPDCLDSEAAITVKEMLLAQRGNALAVDASQVRRVGVQSLQVLVAAARAWQRDGLSYRLENPSPEFLVTISLVGLPRQDLLLEGHQ